MDGYLMIYEEQSPQSFASALAQLVSLYQSKTDQFVADGRTWMKAKCAPAPYCQKFSAVMAEVSA